MENESGQPVEVSCAFCGDVVSKANHSGYFYDFVSKQTRKPICVNCVEEAKEKSR